MLDLRPEVSRVQANFDWTLPIGRLQTLERYEKPGRACGFFRRSLSDTARVVTSPRRSTAHWPAEEERALDNIVLHGEAPPSVVGRVIRKRLIDELGDRVGLMIDRVDGSRASHCDRIQSDGG